MNLLDFCEKVRKNLAEYIGEEAGVSIKKVMKNNGILLHSVIVSHKGQNLSPNIYLDELYRDYEAGEPFACIMDRVYKVYEENGHRENLDISFFLEYEKLRDQVVYKVINREKNEELLEAVPWEPFLDMAIVFYCHVPGNSLGNATIMIYNNHLDMWGITKEQLHEDAFRNTSRIMPARILSIEKMMASLVSEEGLMAEGRPGSEERPESEERPGSEGRPGSEERPGSKEGRIVKKGRVEESRQDILAELEESGRMFVLGNTMKLFGAAAVLYEGLLEQIRERLGRNLFILPSSVHEVILIPDDEQQEAEELLQMVCDINATQVEPEEVLTDSVYYFSRKCGKLEKIC